MGQEAFDIEGCVQKENKRKGVMNMLRKTKRTLSLVLALVMLCSTMGVMAFAADDESISEECPYCHANTRFDYQFYSSSFNRIVECPTHGDHDAEEWYAGNYYTCRNCGLYVSFDLKTTYVCLD